jgi:predicted DNA-binding transcriptional regulator AlpA
MAEVARLMDEKEVAEKLGFKVQTLRNMRARREGPPYIKVGRRSVRYRENDLESYLNGRRIDPEANA